MPDVETLKKHAGTAARTHSSLNLMKVCNHQFPAIETDEHVLLNIYRQFDRSHRTTEYIDHAAEWLLDNFYVILEEIRTIKQICTRKYSWIFPAIGVSQKDAVPRVYALADSLIQSYDAYLNEHIICVYVNEYQTIHALTCREIWAIPIMLKIALIKKIKTIALRFSDLQKHSKSETNFHVTDKQSWISSKESISNAIASLKFLSGTRWEEIFEKISIVDKILSEDPAGVYSDMDFETRNFYRNQIERFARLTSFDEPSIARETVNCALNAVQSSDKSPRSTHVGFYLLKQGQNLLLKRLGFDCKGIDKFKLWLNSHPFFSYLSCLFFLSTGLFSSLIMFLIYHDVIWYSTAIIPSYILAFIPIISISASFTTWIVTKIVSPSIIPKIEIKGDIPSKLRTMVIIPALLADSKRAVELINQLEVFYLANHHKNLHFAIVGDFKDSDTENSFKDQEIIMSASDALDELNLRYCPKSKNIFFLFLRRRQWNPTESVWMGWERKRGAIVEFNRLLKGHSETNYYFKRGEISVLKEIKYVITLDCDTKLPGNAAKMLIGAMAHPLNHAELNKEGNRVKQGYGLLQPRIGISLESANRSHFSSVFSGQTGIDPYTSAVSDVYQDLFGEGIYVGKGIYDVDVFYKLLDNVLPENSILSHDLLEGCIVRAGLVTDVELIDSYPSGYMAYAKRLHRWTRGDWQLIPWMLGVIPNSKGRFLKNPLTHICKWKIIDNLRRSIVNPSLLLLLLFGLTVLPPNPIPWIILFTSMLFFPFITEMFEAFLRAFKGLRAKNVIEDFILLSRKSITQSLLNFVFLPYQSWLMIDAISRVLVRILFTRKGLLEWITAEDTEKAFKGTLVDYHRKMFSSITFGILFPLCIWIFNLNLFVYTIPISLTWILAPTIAYYISKPKIQTFYTFSENEILKLRQLARKTWSYFDELIGNDVYWLPPDNFQIDPLKEAVYRTSPTNIGLWLMSVVSARDLGFIGTIDAVERLEHTIHTMGKLSRWNGHFYNWYSLTTLEPVEPMIISSVDSGNLAVYLVALTESLKDMLKSPLIGREMLLYIKELMIPQKEKSGQMKFSLEALLAFDHINLSEWKILLDELKGMNKESKLYAITFEREMNCFFNWVPELDNLPVFTKELKRHCPQTSDKLIRLLEKLQLPLSPAGMIIEYDKIQHELSECLKFMCDENCGGINLNEFRNWIENVSSAVSESKSFTEKFVTRCGCLIEKIENIFKQMDFKPLYDTKLDLFSVGYDTGKRQLLESYYDLLASEARQTSFIAIAKDDVPRKHWFKLGRRLTRIGNLKALLSWSGTMFEYLMPNLVMKSYDKTLLSETCIAAVKAQIQHCKRLNIPWGISESAFYSLNSQSIYQYKAFGIPNLGYKRGLNEDTVVTPYASIIALQIVPLESFKNIGALINEGLYGTYGLYEAIDYTPQRVECTNRGKIIKTYMAHHQGMILMALNNSLNRNIMQKRFHSNPMVRATELLLQERIPKNDISEPAHFEYVSDIDTDKRNYPKTR